MIRRRAKGADIDAEMCCHTFRATGITANLDNCGTLENGQAMAAQENPRTTKLYDRTSDEVTLNEVERIAIWRTRMVKLAKVLSYMPLGGNSDLWKLRYEAQDERFLRIFGDIAKLIRKSEKACEEVSEQDDPRYQDVIIDAECEYVEELIGASFIVLQTKIRRVTTSALELRKTMLRGHKIDLDKLLDAERIHNLCGHYKGTQASLVQLVWDVGNYYKHRDEWPIEVWEKETLGEKNNFVKRGRQTRRSVERVGVVFASTGNLRTAYKFLGVDPLSKCELLAESVQHWADQVHQTALTQLKAGAKARRGGA